MSDKQLNYTLQKKRVDMEKEMLPLKPETGRSRDSWFERAQHRKNLT